MMSICDGQLWACAYAFLGFGWSLLQEHWPHLLGASVVLAGGVQGALHLWRHFRR